MDEELEFNKTQFAFYEELKNLNIKNHKEYYCFMEELHEYLKIKERNGDF